ncbi:hypothetical protein HF313_01385 [Massilia atriviolacea]|uniref:hypothetical protein n=1 Tax=Massilia atriviolacea TaxID=2495579 RepID=UPI0013DFD921|nr:hypothetical protein [Massilia atriviolacea]
MIAQPACANAPAIPPASFPLLPFLVRTALWFAGVILPATALAVALFFLYVVGADLSLAMGVPVLSLASIPLANSVLLRALGTARPALPRRLGHLHGFAIGSALLSTVLCLPHIPAGVAGLRYFGGGLLLFAPALALMTALAARRLLQAHTPLPAAWPGALLALAIIGAPELPQAVNQAGVHMATSAVPATRANGMRLLRYLGNEKILLRLCDTGNDQLASLTDLLMIANQGTRAGDACEAYYRLSGTKP